MTEQNKTVVSVEILHLDDFGYGPNNSMTRREWRNECLTNLSAGKARFETWQKGVLAQCVSSTSLVVSTLLTYSDNTQKIAEQSISTIALDFIGRTLPFLSLDRHQFLLEVRFDYATFESEVSFRNSTFDRYAWFRGATFKNNTDFSHATFIDQADFKDGNFAADANFNQVTFSKNASFKNANFLSESKFTNTTFLDDVDFYGACLSDEATFLETKFNKHGLFQNTVFKADVRFTKTTFNGVAYFNHSIFEGIAFFDQAHFINDVHFFDSKFKNNACFTGTSFTGDTRFNRSKFLKIADFNGVIFNDEVNFSQVVFDSTTSFARVKFYHKADFENATFNNVGHFENARFFGQIPAFRGCKIDNTRLEFSDDSYFTQNDFTEDAIKNISFLKRLADEHGQTDQALNFNAMELRAKRQFACKNIYTSKFYEALLFILFTCLYEKISDFGRSFARPLFCLLGLLFVSFIIGLWSAYANRPIDFNQSIFSELNAEWLLTKDDESQTTPLTAFRAATEYSLYRSGNFIDFTDADKNTASINMRLFGSEIEPCWARAFGFFKGIATAVLLFLIALGLRNKYRVG